MTSAPTGGGFPTGENSMTQPDSTDTHDASGDTHDAGKDWQAETEKWKALARKHEGTAKANADAAKRLGQIEDQSKSELERAVSAARTETESTVRSELAKDRALDRVEALAARDFADPEDARLHLGSKAAEFVGPDGAVDSDGIRKALADLLKQRPHLAATPTGKPTGNADQGLRTKGSGDFNGNDFLRQLAGR